MRTLGSQRLAARSMRSWLQLALIVAALIAIYSGLCSKAYAVESASPGPMAAAHAAIESQCSQCHVPLLGTPDHKCLACHTALQRQIASKRGFHSTIGQATCVSCHRDHKGRDHVLSGTPSNFDHKLASFALVGKHVDLPCAACHKTSAGQTKWKGIGSACAACHQDKVHRGAFGPSCGSCHGNEGWKPLSYKLEDHSTSMKGGHSTQTCVNCHKAGGRLTKRLDCDGCHKQAHGGVSVGCARCHDVAGWKKASFDHSFCTCKLPGKHFSAPCLSCHTGFKFANTPFECQGCHEKDRKHEPLGPCSRCHSALSWKTKQFDHNRSFVGFAIEGKHSPVACEQCHTKPNKFKLPSKECASCHKVPQHGDFGKCESCHQTAGFAPSSFDHQTTRMPLVDGHQVVACQNCHLAKVLAPKPAQLQQCSTCHADVHQGQFAKANTPRLCTECHGTKSWKPSNFSLAQHANTKFALTGKHAAMACVGCHPNGGFVATPTQCAQCHLDQRHNSRMGAQCERCHQAAGWKPVPGFDHKKETTFALERGHAKRACASCHNADGLRFTKMPIDKKITTACQSCHQPRHGDQFGPGCTTCHNMDTFAAPKNFDHARKTGFPLEQRHAVIACSNCHDRSKFAKVPTSCRGCHGDPHRGANGYECQDCHAADRWRVIRFDHSQTSYPLEGYHNTVACGRCHTNPNWIGVPTQCITCHAGDRPPTQEHVGKNECADCHVPLSWKAIINGN
jgi:hypothetical protein